VESLDEDDFTDEESRSKSYTATIALILALVTLGYFGTALAARITINNQQKIEFGQGIFRIAACDSFINLQLNPSPATYSGTDANGNAYSGMSRVQNILISGLNTVQCAGKNLQIHLYSGGSNIAMSLFTDTGPSTVNRALLVVNTDATTAPALALTIVNGNGVNIGRYDAYEYLNYSSSTGNYTLTFTSPLALMADVTNVTLESTSA